MQLISLSALIIIALLQQPAVAAQPSCPITGPTTTLQSGDTIPTNTTGIFLLSAPGTYTFPNNSGGASATANQVPANVTLCVKGLGATRDDVVVLKGGTSSYSINLASGSAVHLEQLTLRGGGVAQVVGGTANYVLTTNNVKFTQNTLLAIARAPYIAKLHDTEFSDNSRLGGSAYGGAIVMRVDFPGSVEVAFTGETTFARNKVGSSLGSFGGAIAASASVGVVKLVFQGETSFVDNEARAGGAIWTAGAVDVTFSGASVDFSHNIARGGPSVNTPAYGGAIMVGNPTTVGATASNATLSTLTFSSAITKFVNNQASADNSSAAGAAIYLQGHGVASKSHTIQGVFAQNVLFANNSVASSISGGFGGVVSIDPAGSSTFTRLLVQKCMTFESNNVQYPAAGAAFRGAAIGTTATPGTTTAAISVEAGASLVFHANTIKAGPAGAPVRQDVALGSNSSSIVCGANPSAPFTAGSFAVECDMCASPCSAVTGGQGVSCDSCSWTPACLAPTRCPAPPTASSTLIAGHSSCSPGPDALGSFGSGTVCTAVCAPGSSGGGFATAALGASGTCTWQVHPCTFDCSSSPLVTVAGAEPWQCGDSTVAGGECRTPCAAGFVGGPITAVCSGPQWSNTTTGTACTHEPRCLGPPTPNPPNATFLCTSTPVGQPCLAVCDAGLISGGAGLRRECLADGTFGPLSGDACVDCAANKPRLDVLAPSGSLPSGSAAAVAVQATLTAPFVSAATVSATIDGLTHCTVEPAQLTGAQNGEGGTNITVSCQSASPLSAGPHTIAVTAAFVGSNGCSSGSVASSVQVLVAPPPPLSAPIVKLVPAANSTAAACKAPAGTQTEVKASFDYDVTPADGAGAALALDVAAVSPAAAAGATCTSRRVGALQHGSVLVTCTGAFDSALTSLDITATLTASSVPAGSSLVGSATSTQSITFVCCSAANSTALAVSTSPGSSCVTCGGSPASGAEGVWLQDSVPTGVMRLGAVSPSMCSSVGADVGSITTSCSGRFLNVTVTAPPGSSNLTLQYAMRCSTGIAPGALCTAGGSYTLRTAIAGRDSLKVAAAASGGIVYSFIVVQSPLATCPCSNLHYTIRQVGSVGLGSVDSTTGTCRGSMAAAAARARRFKRAKPAGSGSS